MATSLKTRAIDALSYNARRVVYASSYLASRMRSAAPALTNPEKPENADYFTGKRAAYLKHMFSITARNALTGELLARFAPSMEHVWDIGCARGLLATALTAHGTKWYRGNDINPVAIETAAKSYEAERARYPAHCEFEVGSMGTCEPKRESVEVIVFNEVIYYLPTIKDAASEITRAMKWLGPSGVVCISLKDDPKSHAVLRNIPKSLKHITSVIFQEYDDKPRFRIRINRARPAYLVGVYGRA
ncbi:MAG: class I SAM-dependent methyltransferase [Phycisphaerales bacterium]